MRLLHTSDWHLGRTFHGASLADAQGAALTALTDAVAAEGVDVVLLAGDVYDRALPPVEAVALASDALVGLRRAGATVVAIAGNHDSGARLGFGQPLLAAGGLHLCGDPRTAGTPVLVPATDGGGDLAIYPVPYLEPETARHALAVPHARSHQSVLRVALDRARADAAARGPLRTVAMAHAYVAGGEPCDSERVLRVGGSDRVGTTTFAGFDYAALGHLHGRQVLDGDGRIRYAGSPVAYSFSEAAHVKGAWLVDLPAQGAPTVTAVDLPVGRGLATVRGTLADLLADRSLAHAEPCWVQATLTDVNLPREAMTRLRQRFPHTVSLHHDPPAAAGDPRTYGQRTRGRDDLDLVTDFLRHVGGRPAHPAEVAECRSALASAQQTAMADGCEPGGAAGEPVSARGA